MSLIHMQALTTNRGGAGDTYAVKRAGMPLLDEHDGHASLRGLIADGFQVITF